MLQITIMPSQHHGKSREFEANVFEIATKIDKYCFS